MRVPRETHPMFFFRKAWVTALPTQETRIFAAEETQLRRMLSEDLLYEKEDEIYDKVDTPSFTSSAKPRTNSV